MKKIYTLMISLAVLFVLYLFSDPASALAVCSGSNPACKNWKDQSNCIENSCTWTNPSVPGTCSGSNPACKNHKDQSNCIENGCTWSNAVSTPVPVGNCKCETSNETYVGACASAKTENTCRSMSTGFGCTWYCAPEVTSPPSDPGGSGGIVGGAPIPTVCQDETTNVGPVTVIGDSLLTPSGAGTKLKELLPQATIYSGVGMQWSTGQTTLNSLKDQGKLEDTLVFALGTNGPITQANIDSVLNTAEGRNIVLVTNYGPMSYRNANNTLIASAQSSTKANVKLADWDTLADQNKDAYGFSADPLGVHPNKEGYDALARLIAQKTNEFAASSGGEGGPSGQIGEATQCSGTIVSFGITKKFVPFYPAAGRSKKCMTPKYIVVHITAGGVLPQSNTAEHIYQYFASGAEGRLVASQYTIGWGGDSLQMSETLATQAEITYHVGNYNYSSIGIELTNPKPYANKAAVPPAQYQALKTLVRKLMKQYNIPVQNAQYGPQWKASDNDYNPPPGIYGHYQFAPTIRTDPGQGLMVDFIRELRSGI